MEEHIAQTHQTEEGAKTKALRGSKVTALLAATACVAFIFLLYRPKTSLDLLFLGASFSVYLQFAKALRDQYWLSVGRQIYVALAAGIATGLTILIGVLFINRLLSPLSQLSDAVILTTKVVDAIIAGLLVRFAGTAIIEKVIESLNLEDETPMVVIYSVANMGCVAAVVRLTSDLFGGHGGYGLLAGVGCTVVTTTLFWARHRRMAGALNFLLVSQVLVVPLLAAFIVFITPNWWSAGLIGVAITVLFFSDMITILVCVTVYGLLTHLEAPWWLSALIAVIASCALIFHLLITSKEDY